MPKGRVGGWKQPMKWKLDSSLRKHKIIGLMWVQGDLVSLTCSIRGHIHNDDSCICNIYDIEKQVFWDFCHDFSDIQISMLS